MSSCEIPLIEGHAYKINSSSFPNVYINGNLYRCTSIGELQVDNDSAVVADLGIYLNPKVLCLIDQWYFNNMKDL